MSDDGKFDDFGGGGGGNDEGLGPDQKEAGGPVKSDDIGGDVTGSGSGGASGGFGVKGADDGGVSANGAGPSEDALLLSVSKEELSSSGLGRSSDIGTAAATSQTGDMFQRLRHAQRDHQEAAAEVAFSAKQQSDRWIVVFLVGGLYVFFYAIGGLAYYLLDIYGYTVDYSGRANHTGNPNI